MSESFEIWEQPESTEIVMIAGWRQWADAGSISSRLPQFLIDQSGAHQIGAVPPDGFYLFQIPGTHDLVRPVVKFDHGYPESLQTRSNEFFYTGDKTRGVVIFIGDEPHLDIERYVSAVLDAAKKLNIRRIVGLGGVYGELPYEKERRMGCIYSLPEIKTELSDLAVDLSDYHGGASIGSYLCKRAGERGMDYVGLYSFVPTYDFSNIPEIGSGIRIENDFMAWLGAMRRINHICKTDFDLTELEQKSQKLVEILDDKIIELDKKAPNLGIREYFDRLSQEFDESSFEPLDEIWEQELRRLLEDEDSIDNI